MQLTGLGRRETDLSLGDDVFLQELPKLNKQDDKLVAVNQDYGIYKYACSMMAPYGGILSLLNEKEDEDTKNAIVKRGEKNGYVIGKGRSLREGVSTACKERNERNPKNKVMYAFTPIGTKDFNECIRRNYPVAMGCMTSPLIYLDIYKDGVLDGDKFDKFTGGHAIMAYRSEKYKDGVKHINTYPKRVYNEYEVKNIRKLYKSGVYMNGAYVILPEIDLAKKLKNKYLKILSFLALKLKSLSVYGDESYKDALAILDIIK